MRTHTKALSATARVPSDPEILIVDDDAAVREMMRTVLEEHGYRVSTASGGTAAYGVFRAHGPELRLLVTDISMPDGSGPELASALLLQRPELSVLFVSGSMLGPDARLRGMPLLPKPFTADELLARVMALLNPERESTAGWRPNGTE